MELHVCLSTVAMHCYCFRTDIYSRDKYHKSYHLLEQKIGFGNADWYTLVRITIPLNWWLKRKYKILLATLSLKSQYFQYITIQLSLTQPKHLISICRHTAHYGYLKFLPLNLFSASYLIQIYLILAFYKSYEA